MIGEIKTQCNTLFNKNCKDMGIFLIRFDGEKGIIRCKHTEKDNMINLLTSIKQVSSINVSVKTLGTSGTIKSLIKKHM